MRVSVGAFVLCVALTGCEDGRKAQLDLTGKTWSAINDGRGEEAVQLAHLLVQGEPDNPDYEALGRAYVTLAEDRWAAGDRAGASAALREAAASARLGSASALLWTQLQAQPLRIRMKTFADAVAAGKEMQSVLVEAPYLYDDRYFDGVAEIALAYLEIGDGEEAQAMAWRAYEVYWDGWKRRQKERQQQQAAGGDPSPLFPRSWPGLKTVGRVLLETGAIDEGVEIWGQNFTINAYYTPDSLSSDAGDAIIAFREAGRQTSAAALDGHAEPLWRVLADNPPPATSFDDDGDFDAQMLTYNRAMLAWYQRILAALPADNPLRAPYRTWAAFYEATIDHDRRFQQQMAAAEEAAAERDWQEAMNLLGSVAQYVPGLGAATYGLATNNSQAMGLAQQQFQALADAEAAQARATQVEALAPGGPADVAACAAAKGPLCSAADARATAWISRRNNTADGTLPDGTLLPPVVGPAVVAYCSNLIAADVARTCAAEMRGDPALAACVNVADDAAATHDGLVAEALRLAASYSASQGAIEVAGPGGVLDSVEACLTWQ